LYRLITYEALLLQVNRVDATTCKGGEDGEEAEPLRGREDNGERSRRGSLEDLQRSTSPTMLLSIASDHDGYDTRYAKSFIHFTREALPRLDNYRNIMSIQAAYRPTLEELHNATLHGMVGACFLVVIDFWRYAQ
jgi:solute carrier family 12 sodium/potassium/chloride transporter 2